MAIVDCPAAGAGAAGKGTASCLCTTSLILLQTARLSSSQLAEAGVRDDSNKQPSKKQRGGGGGEEHPVAFSWEMVYQGAGGRGLVGLVAGG